MKKDFGVKTWLIPMPVLIIGSFDENGEADAMNAAWGGIYDTNMITISLGSHVSTDNIRNSKAFTVAFATKKTVTASDFVGIVSKAKDPDKMKKSGLTIKKSEHVNAPYFEEYPVTLECKLVSLDGEKGEGGILIGEIVNILVDDSVITDDKIDFKKLEPIVFDTVNLTYNVVGDPIANAFREGIKLK